MMASRCQVFFVVLCVALTDGSLLQASGKGRVGVRHASPDLPHFASFVDSFRRSYEVGSEEYEHRHALYESRVAEVRRHNANKGRRWNAGVNALSDWTEIELSGLQGWKGGKRATAGSSSEAHFASSRPHSDMRLIQDVKNGTTLPKDISWLHLDMSNQIQDQGACGSCWAVSAAAVLQAHAEIYGHARTFSAQELVSCVSNPQHCGGTGGCQGATVELALEYVMKNSLADETETPYLGQDKVCAAKKAATLLATSGSDGTSLGMKGWETLPQNQYEPLLQALYDWGPVAVSVAAGKWSQYIDGIFDDCAKDEVIGHAVLLMGYGEGTNAESGKIEKYWTIRNSWGTGWGEKGYIRLLRRDDEASQCGVDHQPEEGTGCDGGPKEVTVCGMCGILYDSSLPHFDGDGSAAKALAFSAR